MENHGNFVAGMAHDFNNVLTAIMGYVQLAQLTHNKKEKTAGYIEEILTASQRGKELVEYSMHFGNLGREKQTKLNLEEYIEEVLKQKREGIPPTVVIHREYNSSSKDFRAPPAQIRHVIEHLITNALESFSGSQGEIDIVLDDKTYAEIVHLPLAPPPQKTDYFHLKIADKGKGIDPRSLLRLRF